MDSRLFLAVVLCVFTWMSVGTNGTALTQDINRTGCGSMRLCVAEPSNCNPSEAGSCFFTSTKQISGQKIEFQLTGQSAGYVAVILSTDITLGGNDTVYVCANINGSVEFFGAELNNNTLTTKMLNVTSVKGKISGMKIQCTFEATVPVSTSNTSTSFSIAVANGNVTNGTLGSPVTQLQTPVVNIANATANVINQISPPVAPATAVMPLTQDINRTGCGSMRLCVAEPSNCNPSEAGSCFFTSTKQISGQKIEFQLTGQSAGYVAVILSTDITLGGNDTVYVCANINGSVKFFGAELNNNALTTKMLNETSVKGKISGMKIQCTFEASVPDATSKSTTSFSIAVANGTVTNGVLGAPNALTQTKVLNLATPTGDVTNVLTTTAPAPIKFNATVAVLKEVISRADCGSTQLCAAQPSDCDPAVRGSCFFVGAKQLGGNNYGFALSGETDGYLAASLSTDDTLGGNDTTYVCANNNGSILFLSTVLEKGVLIERELNVASVKGKVNGSQIQCTFEATVPSPTTRSQSASFSLAVSTGTYTNGTLGSPVTQLQTPVVNIANPTANVTNQIRPPVAPATAVMPLTQDINRTGCGSMRLCVAEPSNCNPSEAGSCFFTSTKQISGQKIEFQLTGQSAGYVAVILSTDITLGGNDTVYVCANINDSVKFFGAELNNNALTTKMLNVTSVRGKISGMKIQCTFEATVPDSTSNTSTSFSIAVANGNVTNGVLGAPNAVTQTKVLNLATPTGDVTNVLTTTTTAPIKFNATVAVLKEVISKADCGKTQLCAAQPSDCDPAVRGSCFFVGAKQLGGNNYGFALSGETDGYLAASLSTDDTLGGNDTTYVCANNNGSIVFLSTVLEKGVLIEKELNVASVKGKVNGSQIQCTFEATVPSPTTRSQSASFSLAVSTGTYTNGTLGSPVTQLQTPVVNIANPTANVTNQIRPPVAPATAVMPLTQDINRTGCGLMRLCVAEPSNCNPSEAGSCFFTSTKQISGQKIEFQLTGQSAGYVAVILSTDITLGGNDTVYVCANINGSVEFFGAELNNNTLTTKMLNVTSVKGKISGMKIQCTFEATVPVSTSNTSTSFSIAVANGNVTNGTLGSPVTQLQTPVVNIANATANVINQISPPVAPATAVMPLTQDINRTGCGSMRLCVAEPSNCNLSEAGSCFFTSTKQISSQKIEFQLTGQSAGYVAVILSTDITLGGNDTVYVCANINGSVKFFGAELNNNALTTTMLNVTSVKGKISGMKIQCTFEATVPDATSKSTTSFSIAVANGTVTNGVLGAPNALIQTKVLNLATPTGDVTNVLTTTAPIKFNATVAVLKEVISRADCGSTQLCAAQPSDCNPAVRGSCFFVGAKQLGGNNYGFALSGETDGYLAASLSTDDKLGGNDTTYVCANNNGSIVFLSTVLEKGELVARELNVASVKGKVNGSQIQCTFEATVPLPKSRSQSASFSLAVSTGTYTNGTLGSPVTQLQTPVVNIANATANVTNQISPPVAPATAVMPLTQDINRTGCGSMRLCVAEPSNCNPSEAGSCFFTSTKQISGQKTEFQLTGQSAGYVAVILSIDITLGGNDTVYVCANINGSVKFFGAELNNSALTTKMLNVTSVKGKISGMKIQCTFEATVPDATSKSTTSFSIAVANGTVTNGVLGAPNALTQTKVLNLATPTGDVTNVLTTTAPIKFNATVAVLKEVISRADCGSTQLCAAQPSDCNPAVRGSCFFVGAKQLGGNNYGFALSGETDGYLAASLSTDDKLGGNDTTYVCANNNGSIVFLSTVLDKGELVARELNVASVKGKVNGSQIQCTFEATVPLPKSRSQSAGFSLAVSTGTYTNGTLGSPVTQLQTPVVNIANATANVTNQIIPPVAPPTAVMPLTQDINRTGCGSMRLCVAEPSNCNPSEAGSCFFTSTKQISGQKTEFQLTGQSAGYVAVILSIDITLGGNDTVYVCANINGSVKFFGAELNNSALTTKMLNVTSVKGKISGMKIQCTFEATVPDATSKSTTSFSIAVANGTVTNGVLGAPNALTQTKVLNLATPTGDVTNVLTTTAPIKFNATVAVLKEVISRADCGSTQLCAAQPSDCNPAVRGSCFFVGAKQLGGNNYGFALSGETDGYLAASLSTDDKLGGNDTTYVCANNNGSIVFLSTVLDKGELVARELNVASVKGKVNGSQIQCTFEATVPLPKSRSQSAGFSLAVSTGTYTNGTLGSPVTQLQTPVVNIANATANVTNQIIPPVAPPTAVMPLTQDINRTGCGSMRLCVAEPSNCNPSEAGSCFFTSTKQISGQKIDFQLTGQSAGYVAVILSTDITLGGNDTVYVCANINGSVKFFGAELNNSALTTKMLNVTSVKGKISGMKIQCTFEATVPDATSKSTTSFSIAVANGTVTNGVLGAPNAVTQTKVLNLATPTGDVTNVLTTTTTAPIKFNATVAVLKEVISRTDCGKTQLCAAQPSDCDPAVKGSCFFIGAKQLDGNNYGFALSGETDGYLAASLSTDDTLGGNDTTYVCANNNGSIVFLSTVLDKGVLIERELNVASVKGKVNGSQIQCTFEATVPLPKSRSQSAGFSLAVSTGTYTNGTLGSPVTQLQTPVVNIANATANVTNQISPPVAPATAVMPLTQDINRTGCGSMRLCVAEPSNCNPSEAGSCFFTSTKQISGQKTEFQLTGQSAGYVAVILSTDITLGGNDTVYVCANINGSVKFFGAELNNNALTTKMLNVTSVKGKISGMKIQCTFEATVPDSTSNTSTSFSIAVANGTVTNGVLGAPNAVIQTKVLNLATPTGDVTNVLTTTTTTTTRPPLPSHAITLQNSLSQALLIALGVLGLAVL